MRVLVRLLKALAIMLAGVLFPEARSRRRRRTTIRSASSPSSARVFATAVERWFPRATRRIKSWSESVVRAARAANRPLLGIRNYPGKHTPIGRLIRAESIRYVAYTMMIIGPAALLYSKVSSDGFVYDPSQAREGGASSPAGGSPASADVDAATDFALYCAVFVSIAVNTLYFILVINHTVFSQLSHRRHKRSLIMPTVLLVSFLCSALSKHLTELDVWGWKCDLHTVPIYMVTLLYGLWCLRTQALLWRSNDALIQTDYRTWLWVDMLSTGILLFALAIHAKFELEGWQIYVWKDVVIGISLLMIWQSSSLQRRMRSSHYVAYYRDYNDNIEYRPALATRVGVTPHMTVEPSNTTRPSMFDYECGDGRMVVHTCGVLGLNIESIDVDTYELSSEWHDEVQRRNVLRPRRFFTGLDEVDASRYDVLHFSHVLYELDKAESICNLLRSAKPGALIVCRGFALISIFGVLSTQFSAKMLNPKYGQLWNRDILEHLVRECGLVNVLGNEQGDEIGPPAYVVPARYHLEKRHQLRDLLNVVHVHYGERAMREVKFLVGRWQRTMSATGRRVGLRTDELIYLFWKTQAPGEANSADTVFTHLALKTTTTREPAQSVREDTGERRNGDARP